MSEATTEGSSLSPEQHMANMNNRNFVNKMKVLGEQMQHMGKQDKAKYAGQFSGLQKTLGKLRRVLRQKMPNSSWQWTIWISVTLLVLIYAFFGYKLYKSLVERDRKREEKLKAKQSKKKK